MFISPNNPKYCNIAKIFLDKPNSIWYTINVS
nr:MAG TPA: UPF0524 protein [Bacteriophage sp.]